ncbi:unnamed protein product [Parajaminaea phylloscopi]
MAGSVPPSPDLLGQQDLSWLSALQDHPIFSTRNAPNQQSRIVLRGTDAIVLCDGQLRVTNLSALKHTCSGAGSSSAPSAPNHQYRVLSNSLLDDELRSHNERSTSIVLNPTKTLLAVVSATSLLVIILPRGLTVSSNSPLLHVKAHRVGTFYHNSRAARPKHIVSVKWHPWSEKGTSLLVLSRDGTLDEYDVASDLAEPQQSLMLLPSDRRTTSPQIGVRFGRGASVASLAEDEAEDEQVAVAFTLGLDAGSDDKNSSACPPQRDWSPLTVYVLTRTGDVFAAAPFLPRFARLSTAYLQSLSAMTQFEAEDPRDQKQREYTLRFVSHLLRQAASRQDTELTNNDGFSRSTPRAMRETTPADLLARSESRSRRAGESLPRRSRSFMSLDPVDDNEDAVSTEDTPQDDVMSHVDVEIPQWSIVPGQVVPQGPFLLAPAPHELSDAREAQGNDLLYLRLTTQSSSANTSASRSTRAVELLLIGANDGRVDIGVLSVAGKISPRWSTAGPQPNAHSRSSGRSRSAAPWSIGRSQNAHSGRYGLSDSSEDEDEETLASPPALPTLFIYECLDLNFGAPTPSLSPLQLSSDPVYPDTFYVFHGFGMHMVSISSWVSDLAALLGAADLVELQRFLHTGTESQVRWVVKIQDNPDSTPSTRGGIAALQVVDDVYLGYSLVTVLGDGECIGIELALRPPAVDASGHRTQLLPETAPRPTAVTDSKQMYISLLGKEPFVCPAPFNSGAASFPGIRLKTSDPAAARRALEITPETLRLLGTTVQDLRGKLREVVQGGNAMQRRLDLQMKELQRQVTKLGDVQQRIAKDKQSGERAGRIAQINARQQRLIQRVDRVLQGSMDASHTGISQYEEAWLREMEAMEKSVGRSRGEGLSGRVDQLRAQLEQLRPELRQAMRPDAPGTSSSQLGSRQLDRILAALGEESLRLSAAKDKVHDLNQALVRNGQAV